MLSKKKDIRDIVIRTDSSKKIGSGHVMRCLNLADALREKGNRAIFICREHDGNLCYLIEKRGFEVYKLPVHQDDLEYEGDLAHSCWLGSSWEEDARETIKIIKKLKIKPEWLVVDHYALDHRWENRLRPLVKNIFVIDDIADRNHDCDILLDQNLVEGMQDRYTGKVPDKCRLLLGPEYALLQPIYAELHEKIPPRKGPIKKILISFGGADDGYLVFLALSAFISLNRPDIKVDIIISLEKSPYISNIKKVIADHKNIHLHGTLPTLAYLMAEADLAIGAAGTTNWERLCLGLPAIVVTLANNQNKVANCLNSMNLIMLIGNIKSVNEVLIANSITNIINNNRLFEWSSYCMTKCDGNGEKKVLDILASTTNL